MSVNLLAVLLAAVSSMVVGTLWYLPAVFGDRWQRITEVDPNKPKHRAAVYGGSFASAVVTAVVLAVASGIVHEATGGNTVLVALGTAGALWAGFTAAPAAVHYLFEGRAVRLFAINVFHQLATVLVMAVIIGLFG